MLGSRKRDGLEAAFAIGALVAGSIFALGPSPARAADWQVRPESVTAHEDFLASTPLQGRGSATRDEAIAAAYVASEFEAYGLKTAPGMVSYMQVGQIVRPHVAGTPTLAVVGGAPLTSLRLVVGAGNVRASFALFDGSDPSRMPQAPIVVVTGPQANFQQLMSIAQAKGVQLLILAQSGSTERLRQALGGRPAMPSYLEGSAPPPSRNILLASLSNSDIATLTRSPGQQLALSAPIENEIGETTNAIGYLPGTDPDAGTPIPSSISSSARTIIRSRSRALSRTRSAAGRSFRPIISRPTRFLISTSRS